MHPRVRAGRNTGQRQSICRHAPRLHSRMLLGSDIISTFLACQRLRRLPTTGPPRSPGVAQEPVYDTLQPNDDNGLGLTAEGVASGLTYLADNHGSLQTDIAVVPMPVSRSDAMDAAIERLDEFDVIVVAGSGDRPTQEGDPLYAEYGGLDEDSEARGRTRTPQTTPGRRATTTAGGRRRGRGPRRLHLGRRRAAQQRDRPGRSDLRAWWATASTAHPASCRARLRRRRSRLPARGSPPR